MLFCEFWSIILIENEEDLGILHRDKDYDIIQDCVELKVVKAGKT
jgi:hypothetical protein